MHSGHSHSFDTGIAKELGVTCAILYNHVIYWLRINASKGNNLKEGKIWMYETQKEMAEFLEYLTLEEVKKAMVKLLDAGLLIKGNFNKNPFDKTAWYTTPDQDTIGIKKTLTKAPYGAIDNAQRRDPERPMAPCIYDQKEHQEEKQEQQQAAPAAAAASSKKQNENAKPESYECLYYVDVSESLKKSVTQKYDEEAVKKAVDWLMHPSTRVTTTLAQALQWACQNQPEIAKSQEDSIAENKAYAKQYDGLNNKYAKINVLSKFVEIFPVVGEGVYIEYAEKDFKEQFDEARKKYRL